jgi:hypothetical protein
VLGKSVFKYFKEDTEESLRKMFELDFGYTKIEGRLMKTSSQQEIEKVKNILYENYAVIKNIYLTCIINSDLSSLPPMFLYHIGSSVLKAGEHCRHKEQGKLNFSSSRKNLEGDDASVKSVSSKRSYQNITKRKSTGQ